MNSKWRTPNHLVEGEDMVCSGMRISAGVLAHRDSVTTYPDKKKKITFITPAQLSTEAKQLIRNGMPEDRFVKEIESKGYFDSVRTLDQEVDLELYVHLFKHNKETYLSVQRGKHRVPSIVEDEKKYFLMKFPKGMPIPDDIMDEHHVPMRKLPVGNANTGEDLFSFA